MSDAVDKLQHPGKTLRQWLEEHHRIVSQIYQSYGYHTFSDVCSPLYSDPPTLLDTGVAGVGDDGDDMTQSNQTHWSDYMKRQLSIFSVADAFLVSTRIPCNK
jgi:hypothetical protein